VVANKKLSLINTYAHECAEVIEFHGKIHVGTSLSCPAKDIKNGFEITVFDYKDIIHHLRRYEPSIQSRIKT
jgi:hypothetical protein